MTRRPNGRVYESDMLMDVIGVLVTMLNIPELAYLASPAILT